MSDQSSPVTTAYALLSDLTFTGSTDETTAALIALGEAAVPALEDALQINDPRVRRIAIVALSRIDTRSILAPTLNFVARTTDPELRAIGLFGASRQLKPQDRKRLSKFIAPFTEDSDATVRRAAIRVVIAIADDGALARIAELCTDDDADVRREARRARALLQRDLVGVEAAKQDSGDTQQLDLLRSRSASDRRAGTKALIARDDRVRRMISLLNDDSPLVRRAVLEGAAIIRTRELAEVLLDLAADETTDAHERALALAGVAGAAIHDDSSAQQLRVWMDDRDLFVRAEAAALAVRTNRAPLLRAAVKCFNDREAWVRKKVAEAWVQIADRAFARWLPEIVPPLVRATAESPISSVAVEAVTAALETIARVVEDGGYIESGLLDRISPLRGHETEEIARAAVDTLDRVGAASGVLSAFDRAAQLTSRLYSDSRTQRADALRELAAESGEVIDHAARKLVRFLYAASDEEMILACAVLHQCSRPEAEEALTRLAMHPEPRVRSATVKAEHFN